MVQILFLACVAAIVVFIIVWDKIKRLEFRVKYLEEKMRPADTPPPAADQQPANGAAPAAQMNAQLNPLPESATPQATAPAMAAEANQSPSMPQLSSAPVATAQARVSAAQAKQTELDEVAPLSPTQPHEPEPAFHSEEEVGAAPVQEPARTRESWAQFTTVKLFSWIGGFTLFLGVVFFIKYTIENDLISPAMRILLSVGLGIALLITGLLMDRKKLAVTADTLCGSGLAVFFAAIYCAYSFYGLISQGLAFVFMALAAFLSFGVAVWKHAKYIGYLGTVIAFLTPILLSSGQDRYFFFFSYIAFINAVAILSAVKRSWSGLIVCSLIFTWLCQFAWLIHAYAYKGIIFPTLFALYVVAAAFIALWGQGKISETAQKALGAFICANVLLAFPMLFKYGNLLKVTIEVLSFTLLANLALAVLAHRKSILYKNVFQTGKVFIFLLLFTWTGLHFQAQSIWLTFAYYFAFAAVSGSADFLIAKKMTETKAPSHPLSVLFPLLLMLPFLSQMDVLALPGFGVIALLLAALLAITVLTSAISGRTWPVTAGGALTLLAFTIFACNLDFSTNRSADLIIVLAAALLLAPILLGMLWVAARQLQAKIPQADRILFTTSLLPFLLIISVLTAAGSEVLSPHVVFGFVLALSVLIGFFCCLYKEGKPMLGALTGATFVQYLYYSFYLAGGQSPAVAILFNIWALVIFAFFMLYAFILRKRFLESKAVWAAASFSGIAACAFLYYAFKTYYQMPHPGLLPLSFALVYAAAISVVYAWQPVEEGIQRTRLALLSGVMLFFITLIFPLEFTKEWLTIAWALEGAALIGLNHALKHRGLVWTGFGLLTLVFIRLVLNPYIYIYYDSGVNIFNWYLTTFGLSAAAMYAGARGWRPKEEKPFTAILYTFTGVTLFVLMNIEIADYFTPSGQMLQFNLFGSLAATMTYTLAWALYGGICFALAVWRRNKTLSIIGSGLIGIATVKLFIFDIWSLGALYRIFGLFGIAAILILVSLAYQRFKDRF